MESALSAEILRTWQRSDLSEVVIENTTQKTSAATESTDRLEKLIQFVGTEVQGEETITLAAEGFNLGRMSESIKPRRNIINTNQKEVQSAVGLLAVKGKNVSI